MKVTISTLQKLPTTVDSKGFPNDAEIDRTLQKLQEKSWTRMFHITVILHSVVLKKWHDQTGTSKRRTGMTSNRLP